MGDLLGHRRIAVSDLVVQHFNFLPQFTGWQVAEQAGDPNPDEVQRLLIS